MDMARISVETLLEQHGQLLVLLVMSGLLIHATLEVKNIFNDDVEIKPKNAYVKKLRKKRFSDEEIIKYLKIRNIFEFISLFMGLFLVQFFEVKFGVYSLIVSIYFVAIDYMVALFMKIVEYRIENG